ncbi:MAG: hypothetical protein IJX24_06450, partial [Oscillospiraceae bacterium]|nr:hypothetical protein [Oscillospiraceae bacterium]
LFTNSFNNSFGAFSIIKILPFKFFSLALSFDLREVFYSFYTDFFGVSKIGFTLSKPDNFCKTVF